MCLDRISSVLKSRRCSGLYILFRHTFLHKGGCHRRTKDSLSIYIFGGSIEFRVIYRLSCLQVIIEKSGSHGGYPESFVLVFNQIIHALDTVSILVCQILQIAALSCFLIQSA